MDPTELLLRLDSKIDRLDEKLVENRRASDERHKDTEIRLDKYNDLLERTIKDTSVLKEKVEEHDKSKLFIMTVYKVLALVATVGGGAVGALHFILEKR